MIVCIHVYTHRIHTLVCVYINLYTHEVYMCMCVYLRVCTQSSHVCVYTFTCIDTAVVCGNIHALSSRVCVCIFPYRYTEFTWGSLMLVWVWNILVT